MKKKQAGRALPVVVTQSELAEVRTCPWRWRLKYELELAPADAEASRALYVGRAMHEAIAEMWRYAMRMQREGKTVDMAVAATFAKAAADSVMKEYSDAVLGSDSIFQSDELNREAIEAMSNAISETSAAVSLYMRHIFAEDVKRFEVLEVERAFRVPLPAQVTMAHNVWLEGVFDLVLRDRAPTRGMRRLVHVQEHKSMMEKAHTFDFRADVDPQMHLYQYAAGFIWGEENLGSVLLNAIRKKGPREPKMLKDGTISVAACDTTEEVYRAALAQQVAPEWLLKARAEYEAKPTPKTEEKFVGMRKKWEELQQKQEDFARSCGTADAFVKQHAVEIAPEEAWRFAREATETARLVRLFRRGQVRPWRNGSSCTSPRQGVCGYRSPCVMDAQTPDGMTLVKRPHRHPEIEESVKYAPRIAEPIGLSHEALAGT